jgi:hypothetical protein
MELQTIFIDKLPNYIYNFKRPGQIAVKVHLRALDINWDVYDIFFLIWKFRYFVYKNVALVHTNKLLTVMPIILQSKFSKLMLTRFITGSLKRWGNWLPWLGFIGLAVIVSLNGCVKANIQYGQSQIDNGFTNVVELDTTTPVISTTYIDSVQTSSSGSLLIGGYNDPVFGPVTARSYLEITPPPFSTINQFARFDSMVLYLIPNKGAYYGDTSVPANIYVYQLAQTMQYNNNPVGLPTNAFFNIDSFPVLSNVLGHVQQRISPTRHDTVYIKLDSVLGATFFNDYRSQTQYMSSSSLFLYNFPGIRLSGGPGLYNSGAANIFGFKDSCFIKLWYNDATYNGALSTLQFSYSNKAYQFNEVRNTPPAPLNQFQHELNSVVLQQKFTTDPGFNHQAYLDNLLGYNIKVSFPYIRDMYYADTNFVRIQKAQLIFRPIQGTYDPYVFMLPPQLQLAACDYTNVPGGIVSTGTLSTDLLNGSNNSFYTFDVTSYLQSELTNLQAVTNGDGLIIQPVSAGGVTQFNRTVLGDKLYPSPQNNTQYIQTELIIYYLQLKNTL